MMMQDPAIPGYLGRALSLELSAVQQFLALAKLFKLRGMEQAADKFGHEAQEEIGHAQRIIGRMLALGFAPNASHLRPAFVDGSLPQLMQHVAVMEREIVEFYAQAVAHCRQARDHENRIFFETLLLEEQQHANGIESWHNEVEADHHSHSD